MREEDHVYKIGSERFMGQKIGVFPNVKENFKPWYWCCRLSDPIAGVFMTVSYTVSEITLLKNGVHTGKYADCEELRQLLGSTPPVHWYG